MRKYIVATVQNMAKSDVLSMIPEDTLARIKRTDKKPEIKVFAIGHEGTATGTQLSFGLKIKKAFRYVKDMVNRINEKLQLGTGVFNRHAETNEHTGREQIGEVIGKTTKTIGNKLMSLAAIYLYPQHKKTPFDIASFEANVEYTPKSETSADVIDVQDITGIALSHSSIEKPAFEAATLLGVVQAFIQPQTEEERLIAKIRGIRAKLKHTSGDR